MKSWNENPETRRHFRLDLVDYSIELSQKIDGMVHHTEVMTLLRAFAVDCVHGATSALYKGQAINDYHYKDNDVDITLAVHKCLLERSYDGLDHFEEVLKEINVGFNKAMEIDKKSIKVLQWSSIPFIILTLAFLSMFGFWAAVGVPVFYFVLGISLRYYITKNKTLDLLADVLIESSGITTEE